MVRTNLNHELKELMALIIGVKAFYPVHFGQGDNVVPNPLSGGGDNHQHKIIWQISLHFIFIYNQLSW